MADEVEGYYDPWLKRRPAHDNDQWLTETAYRLLLQTMELHPEIDSTIWAGATWGFLVNGYIESGASYEHFCAEWDRIKDNFKNWWDES